MTNDSSVRCTANKGHCRGNVYAHALSEQLDTKSLLNRWGSTAVLYMSVYVRAVYLSLSGANRKRGDPFWKKTAQCVPLLNQSCAGLGGERGKWGEGG